MTKHRALHEVSKSSPAHDALGILLVPLRNYPLHSNSLAASMTAGAMSAFTTDLGLQTEPSI